MNTSVFDPTSLTQFTGSEHFYRHSLTRAIYTDGVAYLAETAGAHWLVDEIAFAQAHRKVQAEEFQVWVLTVEDSKAILTCDDGNGNVVYTKHISFTDFPAPTIKLYFQNGTILLPSEY